MLQATGLQQYLQCYLQLALWSVITETAVSGPPVVWLSFILFHSLKINWRGEGDFSSEIFWRWISTPPPPPKLLPSLGLPAARSAIGLVLPVLLCEVLVWRLLQVLGWREEQLNILPYRGMCVSIWGCEHICALSGKLDVKKVNPYFVSIFETISYFPVEF